MPNTAKNLLISTIFLIVYFLLAWAFLLATGPDEVTLTWPSSGVIYATILVFGWRWWPFPLLATALLHITLAPAPPLFFIASLVGAVTGVCTGVWFVQKLAPHALNNFDIPSGAALLAGGTDLLPDFRTSLKLVESV